MECPFCEATIESQWKYCGKCGTNIKEYEKGNEFMKSGLELEKRGEYSEAAQEYKKVLTLEIPQHKAFEHLERVTAKEGKVVGQLEKGAELISAHKWKQAIKTYGNLLSASPSMEKEILPNLVKAKEEYRKEWKYRAILIGIVIIVVGLGLSFLYNWATSPERRAHRILRQSTLSKDILERQLAIEALGRVGDKQYFPILKDAIQDESPEIRSAALRAMGEMQDSLAIPLLKGCLFDKDWRVSMEAAKSLAILGDTSGIQLLKRILK